MKLKNRSSFRIISSSTTLHQMQTRAAATPIETLGVIHSSYEKSIIVERTMQYIIKDRTESFDDYFPCKKKNKCK